jgi:hypothetical protein
LALITGRDRGAAAAHARTVVRNGAKGFSRPAIQQQAETEVTPIDSVAGGQFSEHERAQPLWW